MWCYCMELVVGFTALVRPFRDFRFNYFGGITLEYTVDYLNACFYLDTNSYTLYWKIRPRCHFANQRAQSRFNTQFSGKVAGFPKINHGEHTQYIKIKLHSKSISAHQIIWAMTHGEFPRFIIDHRDGNGLNNEPSNLRHCDKPFEFNNSRNRKLSAHNTSGFNGVSWRGDRNRWVVKPRILMEDGSYRTFCLGSFTCPAEAGKVWEEWSKKYNFTTR